MFHRVVLGVGLLSVVVALSCAHDSQDGGSSGEHGPPNVLLIVIDTARADHFSCYGYARPTTPRIDQLAGDGVLYTNAQSPAPWTLPSHASMFTGLPPGLHGLHWSAATPDPAQAPKDTTIGRLVSQGRRRLLAAVLSEAGYATVGISNNPWIGPRSELDSGFESFYLLRGRAARSEHRDLFESEYPQWPEELRVPEELFASFAGKSIALLKKEFVDKGATRPFFGFINLIEPHFPYMPVDTVRGRFGGDIGVFQNVEQKGLELSLLAGAKTLDPQLLVPLYDEELYYVDAVVGHLLDWLKKRDLYRDSLIIVTSDHGEHLGEQGRYSHQLSVSRELLWVPLIIKFPGNRRAGTVDDNSLVSTADIYETVLSAAGLSKRPAVATPWSQDLSPGSGFGRAWSIAEYYYSNDYLARLKRFNPEFDSERHKVIRRVAFTEGQRYVFSGGDLVTVRSRAVEGEAEEAAQELLSEVESYLRLVARNQSATPDDRIEDPATIEALRALGYID